MQVHHQRGSGIELHQTQPPRQAFAKEQVVAVVQRGAAEQLALAALRLPAQTHRRAARTGLSRRITHGAAIVAALQLEAPHRRRCRQPERDAAARARRQVHLPRAQHRVFALGPDERHRHDIAPRITAPVHRQRS
jgi:hypothetical protein